MISKLYVFGLALTGCAVAASAYAARYYSRRAEVQRHREDLRAWEAEGGKPEPVAARPVQLS
jgi:hypothetical protein